MLTRSALRSLPLVASIATAFAVTLAAAPPAHAADEAPAAAPIRFSGFGTLGLAYHDNDSAGVIYSFAQRRPAERGVSPNLDSVLGLQMDARLSEATSATLQGVARAGDELRPALRMAYLRQGVGQNLALRLGRVRNPMFMDSDGGEIGFAYLMPRPSLPLYTVVANFVPSLDGADVQWRHSIGPAALLVQGYYGASSYRQVDYSTSPRLTAKGKVEGIRGLALSVILPEVTVRASHTRATRFTLRSAELDQLDAGFAQLAGGLQLAASNPLLPAPLQASLNAQAAAVLGYQKPFDARPVYSSLGVDATLQNWRLLGELASFDSRAALVGKIRGWHATVGHVFGEFTPYVTAARNERHSPALDTSALAPTGLSPALDAGLAQAKVALDQTVRFAELSTRSAGIGMRWDARANLALKVQYERLQTPSPNQPGVFAVPAVPFRNRINLFSATLDFVF